jgi:hypothetical protein
VREDEKLDGGNVLPGFKLLLRQLFARPKPARGGKGNKNGGKR